MSWWKRAGLAFASAMIAETLVIATLAAFNLRGARWDGFLLMSWFALYFVIPGWLLSLPAVLSIRTSSPRNLLTLGAMGILIGPCIMAALELWTIWTNPKVIPRGPGALELLATAISIVATAIYLGGFKTLSRDSI